MAFWQCRLGEAAALSIVGGDPLVHTGNLRLCALLLGRGIHVQIVTARFAHARRMAGFEQAECQVSVDGLQPEPDARRRGRSTSDSENIADQRITLHSPSLVR